MLACLVREGHCKRGTVDGFGRKLCVNVEGFDLNLGAFDIFACWKCSRVQRRVCGSNSCVCGFGSKAHQIYTIQI